MSKNLALCKRCKYCIIVIYSQQLFVIEDHRLYRHLCQVCHPLEIMSLSLFLCVLLAIQSTLEPYVGMAPFLVILVLVLLLLLSNIECINITHVTIFFFFLVLVQYFLLYSDINLRYCLPPCLPVFHKLSQRPENYYYHYYKCNY